MLERRHRHGGPGLPATPLSHNIFTFSSQGNFHLRDKAYCGGLATLLFLHIQSHPLSYSSTFTGSRNLRPAPITLALQLLELAKSSLTTSKPRRQVRGETPIPNGPCAYVTAILQ